MFGTNVVRLGLVAIDGDNRDDDWIGFIVIKNDANNWLLLLVVVGGGW